MPAEALSKNRKGNEMSTPLYIEFEHNEVKKVQIPKAIGTITTKIYMSFHFQTELVPFVCLTDMKKDNFAIAVLYFV